MVALVTACGRIAFDTVAATDSAPTGFVTTAAQLSTATPYSFVDLEVDWSRSLAYVSTRESGECFEAIDFAGVPTIIAREGPPSTPNPPCLGILLDASGTSLVVTSEAGNTIEVWSLGADPRAGAYTKLGSATISGPERIARSLAGANTLYVARNKVAPGVQMVTTSPSAPYVTTGAAFDSANACTYGVDATVDLASGVVLSPCSDDGSPIEIADDQTLAKIGEIAAVPPSGASGFWSTARTSDGTLAVALGWIGVVLSSSGAQRATQLARFQNTNAYRDAQIADRGAGPEVFAIRDDGTLDVISLATPSDPVVIATESVGTPGAYALELSPDLQRAVVVTNRGWFYIVDLGQLQPSSMHWPTF